MSIFRLETFRLIGKTYKRFLSLTLIVFIGAGFMMGLMSTPKIMRESVDRYYDEYDLQDIILYSPYGFCNEDYTVLQQTEGINNVFASREIDCHGTDSKGEEAVYRVSEVDRIIGLYNLVEGRLPLKNNECVYLYNEYNFNYFIGDVITLNYGEDSIYDYLLNDTYTIVGICKSPQYISKIMGSSNYNNESLDSVMFIPNANFISDYYTTMYITLDGAKEILSNSEDYDKFIKENRILIENTAARQQNYLRDQIIIEASSQLEEQEKLFEDLKNQGQKQLDDAKKQLDDAYIQITVYESQLNTLDALVKSLETAIRTDSSILNSIHNYTYDIESDINDILEIFGLHGTHAVSGTMEYLYKEYSDALSQFNSVKGQLSSAKAQYEAGLKEYEDALATFDKEIADGQEQLRLARARLNDLPKSQWLILDRDQQYSAMMYKNNCLQMKTIGTYMPFMFFLVAALVCLTTMKRLIDEQRGQIGIYVALGYSNIQIIGKYVSYAMLASFSGGIAGTVFGQLLFPTVIYYTWEMLYSLPPIRIMFPLNYAILSVGSFSILMTGISAYVVNSCVKDVPASLMRPLAPKKGRTIFLQKIPFLWNMLSFTSKITARNIFRYKARFLMTIAGIAGCAGLLIMGFGIKDSVSDVLGIQYKEIFRYDSVVYFDSHEHIEKNLKILKDSDDVDHAAVYSQYATRVYINNNEKIANMVITDLSDYHDLFNLRETDKKTPIKLSNDGVVVSELFAKNNKLKIGDYITIESQNRIKGEAKISNICEMYFDHYIFISDALYKNIFDEKANENIIAVTTKNPDGVKKIAEKLDDFVSVANLSYFLDSFNNMINALNVVIMVIILVAGSLAFVVLINLTQVNISERIREIATLKVLGFNDHEVNMYIFKEIMLLSLIGCIVGVPIGIIEHRFIMGALSMDIIMFARTIKFSSYIFSFVITIIFTVIVLMLMKKPLREVNMVESLKSVE